MNSDMKDSNKIAHLLNELMEKNYDAEKAYRSVVDDLEDPKLREFLSHQAQHHYDQNQELRSAIRGLGEEPSENSSLEGDVMRTWMNLKTSFSGQKEKTILQGLREGEESALEEYREVLEDHELPDSIKILVLKQQETIQGILEELKAWEASY